MASLETVWVIWRTAPGGMASKKDSSASDAAGRALEIEAGRQRIYLDFPRDLSHDEMVAGASDEYSFDVRDWNITPAHVTPNSVSIIWKSTDAWLPKSIWVIGQTDDRKFHLLVARPDWPENAWFSTESGEGKASWKLDQR